MIALQILFLTIPILMAFGGEYFLYQAPLIKKLKSIKKPLGNAKFSKKIKDDNYNISDLCALPFITKFYTTREKIELEKDDKLSFGEVFSIVSFYEKELSRIIKELRYYSIVIGVLTLGGILFKLGEVETTGQLGIFEIILRTLPVFEIMLFTILIFRIYIEYSKLKSILE